MLSNTNSNNNSNDNQITNEENTSSNNKLNIIELPESILENDIFPYLNSKDLFYGVRGACTEWYELMRSVWSGKIKDEMIDQVKSLDFIYEKELYTKTYEFKMKFLMNYRNLLSAYHSNADILLIAKSLIPELNEQQIKELLLLLFSFCEQNEAYAALFNNNTESLNEILLKEETYINFRTKMLEYLEISNYNKSQETLDLFKVNFGMLNKESLENINESAKLIYSFLQGLIEYQGLKLEVLELRQKIENLIHRIQEETQSWPRKKRFFEKAYKFLLFSKSTNLNIKKLMIMFEENKIRHPLVDYNDEALRITYDLKLKLSTGLVTMENIDEIIFENILSRRLLLTKKILIMERFWSIYKEAKTGNEKEFILNDQKMNLKQLLWCMKFSSNSENENVCKESVLRTKSYLDENFDYEHHVIKTRGETQEEKTENDSENKNQNFDNCDYIDPELELEVQEATQEVEETISPSKIQEKKIHTEEEILLLRKEKERLEEQKMKTEQILYMIKKFMTLKEHMMNNKKKYKLILFLLSKMRRGEVSNLNQETINEAIQDIDVESLNISEYESTISENERNELMNFENSDVLMKEIEDSIMKQIELHLSENRNDEEDQSLGQGQENI
jgi:hypothetical protein